VQSELLGQFRLKGDRGIENTRPIPPQGRSWNRKYSANSSSRAIVNQNYSDDSASIKGDRAFGTLGRAIVQSELLGQFRLKGDRAM